MNPPYKKIGNDKPDSPVTFPDVNRVYVAGHLLQDPPLRKTKRGVPVTNFLISTHPEEEGAVLEGMDRECCQVSVVVWAKQAEQCTKFLRKGSRVLILGELQSMPNSAPDQGFYPIQISAQWIQYLEKGSINTISSLEDEQTDFSESEESRSQDQ